MRCSLGRLAGGWWCQWQQRRGVAADPGPILRQKPSWRPDGEGQAGSCRLRPGLAAMLELMSGVVQLRAVMGKQATAGYGLGSLGCWKT